jgi:predicted permease
MLFQELAYTARTLWRSPVFSATVIVTIALAIGANTAIFSVMNAVLARPLPYKDPDRLVLGYGDMRRRNVADLPLSNADYFDFRNGTKGSFEDVAAVLTGKQLLPLEDGSPEQVRWASVTPNFLHMMGGHIVAGRDFSESDGQPPPQAADGAGANAPAPRVPTFVILSYEYWQRRYGGSTAVLGTSLGRGDPGEAQIVGVLAPKFELLFPPSQGVERFPDVWYAARLAYDNAQRKQFAYRPVGRLKEGASLANAQREAEGVASELRRNFPIWNTSDYHIRLEPMQQYLVAQVQPAILAMMGAVTFLLLIGCANVANLLLVRVSLRERELAVRTALGGSRWRLVRQMLAESLLLAGVGTVLGLGLAWLGIHELRLIAPANLPRLDSIGFNGEVLAFTVLAGLATALVFGMAPAWRASRPDVMHVLRASGRVSGLGGGRILRNGIVVAEVALSFVLLIGSGLMLRSFLALQRIDPGYDAHGLLTFNLFGLPGKTPAENAAAMRQVKEALGSIPGVESVTAASPFPLADTFFPIRWGTEEALTDSSKFKAVDNQFVLPGYFETMRTPLLSGRTFTEADNTPERNLVVVDQFLAAKAFPNEPAVGKRILIRIRTPEPEWVEIIGVVAHQRDSSLAEAGREQIYFTDGLVGHGAAGRWAVRTSGDPAKLAGAVRVAIAKLGGQMLIVELQPMDKWVEGAQAATRFSFLLIGIFAVIAVLLAGVGLYGVLSTAVRQRTAEIGVRMALGAVPGSIFNLVVGQGLRLSAIGIAIGLVAAFLFTRLMTSMLVGVKATDPLTFVAVAVMFFVVASAASWIPARRAATLHPTEALRDE